MGNEPKIEINLDSEYLKKLPAIAGALAFSNFAESVKREPLNFIPQDTGSMSDSFYIDEFNNHYICGYGSKSINDPMNEIVVMQHERALNHYGLPGKSMRIGVPGANIPGEKSFSKQTGESRSVSQQQRSDYWQGYEEKKNDGELQKYSSQFLLRGLEVVAGRSIS